MTARESVDGYYVLLYLPQLGVSLCLYLMGPSLAGQKPDIPVWRGGQRDVRVPRQQGFSVGVIGRPNVKDGAAVVVSLVAVSIQNNNSTVERA